MRCVTLNLVPVPGSCSTETFLACPGCCSGEDIVCTIKKPDSSAEHAGVPGDVGGERVTACRCCTQLGLSKRPH